MVSWYDSIEDVTILNVDDNATGNPWVVGFHGLVRSSNDDLIISFHGQIC